MPVNLSIKNVPDAIAAKLKKRAARHHRSLQGELMAIIEEAIKEQPRLTLDEIWERGNRLGLSTPSESVQMIRVEVIGDLPTPCAQLPTVGDRLL